MSRQARISYTRRRAPVAAAMLVRHRQWDVKKMAMNEELRPQAIHSTSSTNPKTGGGGCQPA